MYFLCLCRIYLYYDFIIFFCFVKEFGDNNGGLSSVVENLFFLNEFDFFDL